MAGNARNNGGQLVAGFFHDEIVDFNITHGADCGSLRRPESPPKAEKNRAISAIPHGNIANRDTINLPSIN